MSLPYPSDNAKRQLNVMDWWMGLKWSSLTLCCNIMYTFFPNIDNNPWRYQRWKGGSKNITSIWRFVLSLGYGRLQNFGTISTIILKKPEILEMIWTYRRNAKSRRDIWTLHTKINLEENNINQEKFGPIIFVKKNILNMKVNWKTQ